MALLWMEGYDQYGGNGNEALTLEGEWLEFTCSLDNTKARTGNVSMASNNNGGGYSRRSLNGDQTTVGIGCGFFMVQAPISPNAATSICEVRDVNDVRQVWLTCGTTGRLQVWRDDTAPELIGASTFELAVGTWNHIELKVVLDDSVGAILVYVNGVKRIDVSGINTLNSNATIYGSQVGFGAPGGGGSWNAKLYWDDIFVYNQDTGGLHDILGQYGVYTLMPNGDASPQDWALSAGSSAFALIDEIPPDDTTFIFATTATKESDFTVQPLPANIVSVAGVQPTARLLKTDTGDCSVQVGVQRGGNYSLHTAFAITTSGTFYWNVDEIDPDGSGAWSPTHLPDLVVKRIL